MAGLKFALGDLVLMLRRGGVHHLLGEPCGIRERRTFIDLAVEGRPAPPAESPLRLPDVAVKCSE